MNKLLIGLLCLTFVPKASGQFTESQIEILNIAFDSVQILENSNAFTWEQSLNHQVLDLFSISDSAVFISKVIEEKNVKIEGVQHKFMILETHDLNAVEYQNILSIVRVEQDEKNKRWHLLLNNYFFQGGNYGASPPFRWLKYSDSSYGVLLENGYTNMGQTSVDWIFYAFNNSGAQLVLDFDEAYYDNSGICEGDECVQYDSELKMIAHGGWDQILITKNRVRTDPKEKPKKIGYQKDLFSYDEKTRFYRITSTEMR